MMLEVITLDSQIAAPTVSAVSLAYAQEHIRALGNIDAQLIQVWIDAATSYFEEQTGRQLMTATWETWFDAFPFVGATGSDARIELPHPPLQSVVSVKYLDGNGVLQSLVGGSPVSNLFRVVAPAGDYASRGFVEPLFGQAWPTAIAQTSAVKIQYTCGYGSTPDDVPTLARGVICYLVAHFDTFRAAVHEARRGQVLELPYGVQVMLDGFKQSALPSQRLRRNQMISRQWVGPWL